MARSTPGEDFDQEEARAHISMVAAWSPYIIVAALLVITRLDLLPFKEWLVSAPVT